MQSRLRKAPLHILAVALAAAGGCATPGVQDPARLSDRHTPPAGYRLAALAAAEGAPAIREQSLPAGPREAEITFLSTPPGATVIVNGRTLPGRTPIDGLRLPARPSAIEFRLDNHEPVVMNRTWEPGARDRLDAELRPRVAQVTLVSTPPGATVWVNGERVVRGTPIDDVPIPGGRSRIEFYLSGYEPAVIERTFRPSTRDRVEVTLSPPAARVTFLSRPPGATVTVNGKAVSGRTPIDGAAVPPGAATIVFQLDGHRTTTLEREWAPKARDLVEARLAPLPARVTFVSTPPGASVWLGGEQLDGTTPAADVPVPAGRWTVEFRLDEHEPAIVEREWRPGTADRVAVELRSSKGTVRFVTQRPWERIEVDGTPALLGPDDLVSLPAGRHTARAYSGDQVGGAAFDVAAGSEVSVQLAWQRHGPASDQYVFFPAGRAALGSEGYAEENPPRKVDLGPFWISRREVTVTEYRACVEAGPCVAPGSGPDCNWSVADRGEHPVNCVAAHDAEAYAAWLSTRDGLTYSLPTADQWERAARGTEGRRYPWGDGPPAGQCNMCDRACRFHHFKDRDADDGWAETAPVGALAACTTPEGVLDLVGNVAEWCRVDEKGDRYGLRGGSWGQIGGLLDPAFPSERPAAERDATIGFRLVVTQADS